MVDISDHVQLPTIQAIYSAYEKRRGGHRPHLGASQIGHHCDRYLWYQFRWAASPSFDGRILRLFDHGDAEESRLVRDLRRIGVEVYDVDSDTGKQWNFTAFGGHFGCSLDAVGHGFPESGKWHLLEFKTASKYRFDVLIKDGLAKWNPQYLSQVVIGMELAELSRTLHLTVCKDDDRIYGERIKAQPKEAERLLNRAERVIFSESPLERVSERADWYQCKWCEMAEVCHHAKPAEVNCRTCAHSTPIRDGSWHCNRHDETLSVERQHKGCDRHIYRPDMLSREPTDAGQDWIEYDVWRNHADGSSAGRNCYTSREVKAGAPLTDRQAEDLRMEFGGRVEFVRGEP